MYQHGLVKDANNKCIYYIFFGEVSAFLFCNAEARHCLTWVHAETCLGACRNLPHGFCALFKGMPAALPAAHVRCGLVLWHAFGFYRRVKKKVPVNTNHFRLFVFTDLGRFDVITAGELYRHVNPCN